MQSNFRAGSKIWTCTKHFGTSKRTRHLLLQEVLYFTQLILFRHSNFKAVLLMFRKYRCSTQVYFGFLPTPHFLLLMSNVFVSCAFMSPSITNSRARLHHKPQIETRYQIQICHIASC